MLGTKIGIDLGTSTVFALVEGRGVIIKEPSVIAYDTFNGKIKAIGKDAYKMIGKAPDSLTVVQPMRDGFINNYDAVQTMLSYYIQKLCGNRIFKPNVIICVPAGANDIDRKTVLDLVTSAGASRACVVEEPLAAALGAGISADESDGRMIVDIGGGTTDIAVITRGCIAVSSSVNISGNSFDEAICRFTRNEKSVIIGSHTAERIKMKIGTAKILDPEIAIAAVGQDSITKMPKSFEISSTDIFNSIKEPLDKIVEGIMALVRQTPPELVSDVTSNGIILTGGSAMLRGIDEYIEEKTGLRTRCADKPIQCVIKGIDVLLEDMSLLEENGYVFKSIMDFDDYEE